jgi:hypothetical protein
MDLIPKTTVTHKNPGDIVTAADINSMNDTINTLVAVVNGFLRKWGDANLEAGVSKREFTLPEAALQIPLARRSVGMKLKFWNAGKVYAEYYYKGVTLDDNSWSNPDNWFASNLGAAINDEDGNVNNIVDGGEWVWANEREVRTN